MNIKNLKLIDKYISLSSLCKDAGVVRNDVWKQIYYWKRSKTTEENVRALQPVLENLSNQIIKILNTEELL